MDWCNVYASLADYLHLWLVRLSWIRRVFYIGPDSLPRTDDSPEILYRWPKRRSFYFLGHCVGRLWLAMVWTHPTPAGCGQHPDWTGPLMSDEEILGWSRKAKEAKRMDESRTSSKSKQIRRLICIAKESSCTQAVL